jgi:hypothetical protein
MAINPFTGQETDEASAKIFQEDYNYKRPNTPVVPIVPTDTVEKYPRIDTTAPTYIAPTAPVIDEAAIRKAEEDAIAQQIKAIEGVYAGEIAKARQTGGERVKQRTAISTVRGGAGSDFAAAEKDVVEQANADIENAINAQMNAEIASARSKGGENARAAIKAAYENAASKKALADAYIADEKTKFTDAQQKATILAQSGSPYEYLDEATRSLFEKYYGQGARDVYNKLGKTTEKPSGVEVSAGASYIDPNTGKLIYQAPNKPETPSYSGTVGEYQFYVEQEKAAGRTPKSFTEYQNEDANRKARAEKASIAGLDPSLVSIGNGLGSRFDSSPIVKQYNEVQNKKLGIDRLLAEGKVSGPQDVALVYDFMKALDPTSVVRESEYAMGASSGNIFLGALAKFNGLFNEAGGKLPENVKKEFQNIINQRYSAISQQYNNKYSEEARKMQALGITDPTIFLTNYSQAETTPGVNQSQLDYAKKWETLGTGVNYEQAVSQYGEEGVKKMMEASGITFNNEEQTSLKGTPEQLSYAIGQYESGGNYNARGPVVTEGQYKGQRAMGKYQIMPGNLPSWSKQALGRVVSESEFMSNPAIQDKIAQYQIGQLLAKHGNNADVASAWFTGRPLAKAGNAKDVLGTTAPQYVKNVLSYIS